MSAIDSWVADIRSPYHTGHFTRESFWATNVALGLVGAIVMAIVHGALVSAVMTLTIWTIMFVSSFVLRSKHRSRYAELEDFWHG